MTLIPYADYFNHTDTAGGGALYTAKKTHVVITADRGYNRDGEEVCFRYGAHGNDELLVECETFGPLFVVLDWDV